MAQCAYCRSEIELCDGGMSICVKCSDRRAAVGIPSEKWLRVRVTLNRDLLEATTRANSATEVYLAIVAEVPSSLYQDGVQRIHNASAEQAAARKQLMKAHIRFNDFLSWGIVPEDLKQQLS